MVELKQTLALKQTLSPQQILLSTLLQLPILALEQKVKMELEQNPVIEEDSEMAQEELEEEVQEFGGEVERDMVPDGEEEEREKEEGVDEKEIEWENILNAEDDFEPQILRAKDEEKKVKPYVSTVSFAEHLLSQLHLLKLTEKERLIGEQIIWNINEEGYLSCQVEEIAKFLNVSIEEVESVLRMVQKLDPVGVGSRNLKECLLVQLEDRENSSAAIRLIRDHFDDYANKRFEKIIKEGGFTLEQIKSAHELISRLNPKPGEGYITPEQNYIIPDFIVEKVDGEFVIALNEWNVPRLRISEKYRKMATERDRLDSSTRQYLKRQIESARWLINSIHQRRMTMLKVMKAIVERQREFFEYGRGHLKPMILKDIADDINMHIATVSRVTSGKYVQTDHGVFELKYFFSEGLETSDGETVSTKTVRRKIREIIENEPPDKPLSDQRISQMLKRDGYNVARRTVAKYREQMRIPIARLRRKI